MLGRAEESGLLSLCGKVLSDKRWAFVLCGASPVPIYRLNGWFFWVGYVCVCGLQ